MVKEDVNGHSLMRRGPSSASSAARSCSWLRAASGMAPRAHVGIHNKMTVTQIRRTIEEALKGGAV